MLIRIAKGLRDKWKAFLLEKGRKLPETENEPLPEDKDVQNFKKICNNINGMETFVFYLTNIPAYLSPKIVTSPDAPGGYDDSNLVQRIVEHYQHANTTYSSESGGFWGAWDHNLKGEIHQALISHDHQKVTDIVRNPGQNTLFWGFDNLAKMSETYTTDAWQTDRFDSQLDGAAFIGWVMCDAWLNLAVITGAARMEYPESGPPVIAGKANFDVPLDIHAIFAQIEAKIGVELNFPNPFAGELGFATQKGVASIRAIWAVYQAWRIAQRARGNPDFKVLEIGAGLGRTAYYANLFGVTNYTIVDIPMTNVAQAYFLGRVLGEDAVRIGKESRETEHGLRVISTSDFRDHQESYDLIFNCDSLTEMPREVAQGYWDFARRSSRCFLSINHEANEFTVENIYSNDHEVRAQRHPYPMRRGYVEELIEW